MLTQRIYATTTLVLVKNPKNVLFFASELFHTRNYS